MKKNIDTGLKAFLKKCYPDCSNNCQKEMMHRVICVQLS